MTLKQLPRVPLEAEVITPDRLRGLNRNAMAALPVFHGKRQCRLDDFFTIDIPETHPLPSEAAPWIELHGDLSRVKWLGRGMSQGRLQIYGPAGMHLGAHMSGGQIEAFGRVGDWAGAEMSGGYLHIYGDCGGQLGAAYRGSTTGMRGGLIVVEGSAGIEIGMRMKRGTIVVRGSVRDFAGLQMTGGTIILLGGAELRTGAWMVRGTILTLQSLPLLPTFTYACLYHPTFLSLYARYLQPLGITIPHGPRDGFYHRWIGDCAVPGKGEILVWEAQP
jgi:formylmethanofuran dehydrogenase subunit C